MNNFPNNPGILIWIGTSCLYERNVIDMIFEIEIDVMFLAKF